MQRDAGDRLTPGDLREFSRSGNGSERKIPGADFSQARRLDGEHGAVGRDAKIRCGGIGRSGDELIWSGRIPHGDRATGRGAKGRKNLIARSRALDERSEEHTSELQSRLHLVCRLLLEKK